MRILVLNGPNLNLLGQRQPDVYGDETLDDVAAMLRRTFPDDDLVFHQSNHEGALIDAIHQADREGVAGIVLNPGGYGHTSVALRDAIESVSVPVVEVHVSNIHGREDFRRRSMLAPVCAGQIAGLGIVGYELAVRYLRRGAS